MGELGWQRRGFLNLLGVDPRGGEPLPPTIELAEAGVDPRTGGAIAVTTQATVAPGGVLRALKTYYWRMLPNGKQLSQKLFDLRFAPGNLRTRAADGSLVNMPAMLPQSVYVLGRRLLDESQGDEGESTPTQEDLNRVVLAIGQVNHALRRGELPNIAQILEASSVHEAVGERLTISGQSPGNLYDFDLHAAAESSEHEPLRVPLTVARALTGFGVNTLDAHQQLRDGPLRTIDHHSGHDYLMNVRPRDGENPKVAVSLEEVSLARPSESQTLPRLSNVKWKGDGAGFVTLQNLNLLGDDLGTENWRRRMQVIGATNAILHDARRGHYSAAIDHLVQYDLYDLVHQFTPPPPLSAGGRLTMVSAGGNNLEEIVAGFGQQIGGNCKVVMHEGLTRKGKLSRVGVIIDLGLHLSAKDEPNIWAVPDVIDHLKYCHDILITHRHLDHADGLFAYMQAGLLRSKTVHATPEVIRAIKEKLRNYSTIPPENLPAFDALTGQGWLHIRDRDGSTRLSVNYARNATPHSARTTPFIVHAHYDGKWLGSYLNPGDSRFGKHHAADYDGPPVDGDPFDRSFFTESNQRFLAEMQRLEPQIAQKFDANLASRRPTYFDLDCTAIERQGWGATEGEVEENLHEIAHWFRDKGLLLAMISTNESRFETALRVATRAHRDITEFGTNLVKTATAANVLGVNDLRVAPGHSYNIQRYLDWYFESRLTDKITRYRTALAQTSDPREQKRISAKLERHEARLSAFYQLTNNCSAFHRYQLRETLETRLRERFGRTTTLGSMIEDLREDENGLGSLHAGRTTKTARAIMGMNHGELLPAPDGGRLVLLTGTQGTNAEVDSALSALAEGRHPTLNGNPHNNPHARPVVAQNHVVVISQSAITGNGKKQDELVRKLAAQGFTVVQAQEDGLRIHNLDAPHRKRIVEALKRSGKEFEIDEGSQSLLITGMPIHASGHGYRQDCEAWLKLVKADYTAVQHSSNLKAAEYLAAMCAQHGQRCLDRIVPNFEGISIQAGETAPQAQISSVGKTIASIIRGETVRQQGKYHSGHIKAQQWVATDVEGGVRPDGLMASAHRQGPYRRAFAEMDREALARGKGQREASRLEPDPWNRTAPPGEREDRGPHLPGADHRHRLFARAQRRSAALQER